MRLGAARRLRKGPEFERVFREGAAVGGPLFVIRSVANDVGYPRWGFAVGKKSAPLAATRNRLKRQLKAAVQAIEPSGSVDVVVVARPAAIGKPYVELHRGLARSLARAGIEVSRR